MKKSIIHILCFLLYISAEAVVGAQNEDTNTEKKCGELGDCPSSSLDCQEKCGCDRFAAYVYNETTGTCILSFKRLMIPKVNVYSYLEFDPNDDETEHELSRAIRIEAEKLFEAILISVIIFVSCCVVCIVSACLYCCRMTYSDYQLKSDIKALAKKLKRNQTIKKGPKKRTSPVEQSCNIVCEDAGVFVV